MIDPELLEDALGGVYDTVLCSAAWPVALQRLAALFSCHFAGTSQRTHDYNDWRGFQIGLDEREYQDVFLGCWMKNNVWGTRRPTQRAGDIVVTRDMISPRELRHSDMYAEFLGPRGLEEGLRLDINVDTAGVENLSLLRPWSAGPFNCEELRAAKVILPHLQRASAVRRRMAEAASVAEAGLSGLDYLQMGVLLLKQDGRVAYANRAAEALLALKDAVSAGPDGLAGSTTASTGVLSRLISRASGRERGPPRSGSVQLPCASDRPSVLAVATPIRPGAHDPFNLAQPAAMLCLFDRCLHRTTTPDQLKMLFDLTRSEAEIACALVGGGSVHEIAGRTGRSVHTIRSLLSRVMAKTETNRQAELVSMLTRMPPQV